MTVIVYVKVIYMMHFLSYCPTRLPILNFNDITNYMYYHLKTEKSHASPVGFSLCPLVALFGAYMYTCIALTFCLCTVNI